MLEDFCKLNKEPIERLSFSMRCLRSNRSPSDLDWATEELWSV